MPEISTIGALIAFAILVIGPGGGVYIGLRTALKAESDMREIKVEGLKASGERIERVLTDVLKELRTLNHRVTKSEARVEGLERREP